MLTSATVRVLADMGHPAHVHFFRHALHGLEADGHEIVVTARDKDVAVPLLVALGIPHRTLGPRGASRPREYVQRLVALARLVRHVRPDVVTAVGGAFIAPAGRLAGVPSVVFTDTEHVALDRLLTYPIATRICTPYTFKKDLPRAQVRYHGLHELAYLSPDRFRPDPAVRHEMGLGEAEPFAILRLVAWGASHDRGHRGLTAALRKEAIRRLSAHGRVFVSAEGELAEDLRGHHLSLPPERIHHALALARVYLGEGATMATEAGLLGTPSVYVSTLVGTMGNFDALEKASLVRAVRDGHEAVEVAAALMADSSVKENWAARARAFAEAHVDVTAFIRQQLLEIGGR